MTNSRGQDIRQMQYPANTSHYPASMANNTNPAMANNSQLIPYNQRSMFEFNRSCTVVTVVHMNE